MPRHHVVGPTSRWWLMIRWEAIMVAVGKVGVFCNVAPIAAIDVWYWGGYQYGLQDQSASHMVE